MTRLSAQPACHPVARTRAKTPLRSALLQSVSLSALVVAGSAHAGTQFRTLGQALASRPPAAFTAAASGGGAAAAKQAALGTQNVAAAAVRFRSLADALAAQANTTRSVPDGVVPGGLQQAAGVAGSNNSTLWSGASTTLGQSVSNGVTTVTVNQTQPVAALTWQTFNIGAHTKLTFNQSATNWVAINSVSDPQANPSVILGQISAPGKVYILNQSGVLFGAGSQVNVGALIAATAKIAEAQFTRDSATGTVTGFNLYGSALGTTSAFTFTPTFTDAAGPVTVEAGATISTPTPTGSNTGGYVMLLGTSVQNSGVISTPRGQTILSAGDNFTLQPGYSPNSNPTSTVVGSEIASSLGTSTSLSGSVTNSGIILADQGDITLNGYHIAQNGILLATTTVNYRGTIHLLTDASASDTAASTTSIVLGPGSVTEVLPEDDGSTVNESVRAANLASSVTDNASRLNPQTAILNDYNVLPDTLGESRIEISTGGTIDMQPGAIALAQGGQVAMGAGQSVFVEGGATIDVSGANAVLPAISSTLLGTVQIVPYFERDSAGNRNALSLEFQNVAVDARSLVEITSGAYAGNYYTTGGLLELSGVLGNVQHGINEYSSLAGQVTLQSGTYAGGAASGGTVTVAPGATINLTGGTTTYQAGFIPQSYVQASDGRIYNVNNAPANLVYVGVYNGVTETQARWHVSNTYVNPLLTPSQIYQASYVVGHDAGTLTVTAASAQIDGTVAAGVTIGTIQVGSRPATISDPFLLAQSVAPISGTFEVGDYFGGTLNEQLLFNSDVVVGLTGYTPPGGSGTPVVTALPDSATGTISIDATQLNAAGFSNVTLNTGGNIDVQSAMTLAPGGSVSLSGNTLTIAANITAPSGTIALATQVALITDFNSPDRGSITVTNGATLETAGLWTNQQTSPASGNAAGYANGGSVSLFSDGGLTLDTGTTVDVSSGGYLTSTGTLTAANGGSVSLSADVVPGTLTSLVDYPVTIGSRFLGYASGKGGRLSITAPEIELGSPSGTVAPDTFVADNSLLSTGFAGYVLNSLYGTTVDPDAQINVVRPVYVLGNPLVPSGAPAASAYTIFLPNLYTPVAGRDTFTQRAGASLTLASSIEPDLFNGGGGTLTVGAGSTVSVDPGQSITLDAYGQVTVQGTLVAHGGTITVANTRYEDASLGSDAHTLSNFTSGLSVWIDDGAVLDASGQSVSFTDQRGRRFGQAGAGGTILLGGLGGLNTTSPESTYAQVIVRPGAVLNVTGASTFVDAAAGLQPARIAVFPSGVELSGNAGTIAARSYSGVAIDGTMDAHGAGPRAAGGSLLIQLDPFFLDAFTDLPADFYQGSRVLISQNTIPVQTETDLQPGMVDPTTYRLARISQQQLDEGGFDTLFLAAEDQIAFDGSANLSLGRSVTLQANIIGSTQPDVSDSISAPHVALTGFSSAQYPILSEYTLAGLSTEPSTGTLTISASLLDIANAVVFGGVKGVGTPVGSEGQQIKTSASAFGQVNLDSTGDIRFDGTSGANPSIIASSGNITFQGAQLYPATGATALVEAGANLNVLPGQNEYADGTLTILGLSGTAPAAPYSVAGTLAFVSGTVIQDGVVRAPEGVLRFGTLGNDEAPGVPIKDQPTTNNVTFGPDSITSVSLNGQTIPYGGTVDGVNYLYNGKSVSPFFPEVIVDSGQFTTESGSIIDLRGGGILSGAGFIPGRGGSADVNTTPLLNSTSGTVTANTTNPVYAIVAGYGSNYAPVAPGDNGYNTPGVGEQITIASGEVAGLAAGTYTLLPAYYDLLPGGYRVELTGAAQAAGTSLAYGNYTTIAAVTVRTAGTSIQSSLPVAALITPGSGVLQLSQYNQESYNTFAANSAATFNSPRPLLPQDGKTLNINLNPLRLTATDSSGGTSMTIVSDTPIDLSAGSVLSSSGTGGYGAVTEITGTLPIEILGPGDVAVPFSKTSNGTTTVIPVFAIDAPMLDALSLPRLVVGGTLTVNPAAPYVIQVNGVAPDVSVLPNANLAAGDIILTTQTSGAISVMGGATLSTLGQTQSSYNSSVGYYFNSDVGGIGNTSAYPVLAVSNQPLVFIPNTGAANGAQIVVQSGAAITADGSLDFVGPSGTSVEIGLADLSAKQVSLQVADINLGSQTTLGNFANVLPGGLTIDDNTLNTLAQNASQLILTAQQAINILGDIAFNSGNTTLVLNTPAIYGYGISGGDAGIASITAPTIYWGGVSANQLPNLFATSNVSTVSAQPGGMLAGMSSVTGQTLLAAQSLMLAAGQDIVLGYGPLSQANDQADLARLAEGFGNVTLSAAHQITANNQSNLSVYAAQTIFGQPGTGGNLTLDTPLLTASSGAVLGLTTGGTLLAMSDVTPAATGTVTTLGGEIDMHASEVDLATSVALPAGKLIIDAQNDIHVETGAAIDLAGRATPLFDQTAISNGGTLQFESTAGNITQDSGSTISVISPGGKAGGVSLSALAGTVTENGALGGGSFSVIAGTLGTSFDALNAVLDAGGFGDLRSFEVANGDITVDQTITAHTVEIVADAGNLTVAAGGTINASGKSPGSIALSAGGTLTLESGSGSTGAAVLDAHATSVAVDSYGLEIDAENRAHVTLTSANGAVVLNPGVTIDVSYPDSGNNPQGQVVINTPRTTDGLALSAPGSLSIIGAAAIDAYGFQNYQAGTSGIVVQDNGTGTGSGYQVISNGTLGLNQVNVETIAWMAAVDGNSGLLSQVAGLVPYGSRFNIEPGVLITSGSSGNLTLSGDFDLSGYRYSDPAGIGSSQTDGVLGSGEPGSIMFRAANTLAINGSFTDGFALPPDEASGAGSTYSFDTNGWTILGTNQYTGAVEQTNSDILLPASAFVTSKNLTTSQIVLIGSPDPLSANATYFDTIRPISLNYDIAINPANLRTNIAIPFSVTVGNTTKPVPAGGFTATASVTRNGVVLFQKGALIPAGFTFQPGDVLGAGFVSPVTIQAGESAQGTTTVAQVVPAGTMLNVFADGAISLAADTAPLPVNALIPANADIFAGGVFNGTVVAASNIYLRPKTQQSGQLVQGYLYPLASMLPAGDQSWSMSFVAGANLQSASPDSVTPKTVLDGGALATPANTINQGAGNLLIDDQHYVVPAQTSTYGTKVVAAFSVIRTGTGDLSLSAGGNIDQSSLYGIYTAGTQAPLGNGQDAQFNSAREAYGSNGALFPGNTPFNTLIPASYSAYYPTAGGDVSIVAGGDMTSTVYSPILSQTVTAVGGTDVIGNWLWRQGSTQLGQPTSWWINFGTIVEPLNADGSSADSALQMTGFQGIGTLGGGNVNVSIAGNAGQMTDRDEGGLGGATGLGSGVNAANGEGLVIAVGSTGRLLPGTSTPILTGGGDVNMTIGGMLNPLDAQAYGVGSLSGEPPAVNGDVIDVRGDVAISAGAVGRIQNVFNIGTSNLFDPRAVNPFDVNNGIPNGGIALAPGDGAVTVNTLRDLVVEDAVDPGRVAEQNLTDLTQYDIQAQKGQLVGGGETGFTLWQAGTTVSLFSNGGNVTPTTIPDTAIITTVQNELPTDFRVVYPPSLLVTAASGDIIYGQNGVQPSTASYTTPTQAYVFYSLETMPSPTGQAAFLAGRSIIANGYAIDMSGADPATISQITDPAFTSGSDVAHAAVTNILPGGGTNQSDLALFALAADTPTTNLHAADPTPALFYAATGDIMSFQTGETISFIPADNEALSTWYLAAKPVWIKAGQDIVSTGTRPNVYPGSQIFGTQENQITDFAFGTSNFPYSSGNLFLNTTGSSVSVISAGRDILSAYAYVAGPGTLDVEAGRNIFQASDTLGSKQELFFGSFKSLGNNIFPNSTVSTSGGASIYLGAGLGASGPDYTAFADLYFNPANQADLSIPITDSRNKGKVQQTYATQLQAWLRTNYGYTGDAAGALAALQALPQSVQDGLTQSLFYAELQASGAQYNDASSRFYHSYARGRQAIDTLFPSIPTNPAENGTPSGYTGSLTMLSGSVANGSSNITTSSGQTATFDSGVATLFGGNVQVLDPGGGLDLGTPGGLAPGNSTGIVTYGSGDIDIYSLGSVLLGKSRVFTTGGGNIVIWSSAGDINAGIGATTTQVYNPPVLVYDLVGDVTNTPPAAVSGAGIAALQSIPGAAVGNISLIAPVGTIDAGEAGIRATGNINLAARTVSNAGGIQGGSVTGAPTVAVTSLGAATAAAAASGAATQSTENQLQRNGPSNNDAASILEVEVIAVGATAGDDPRKKKRGS